MHARAEFLIYKLNYYDKIFLKVYKYFLLTCLQAEQVYPERGGGLPLVLQQPHAAADHERDGGGPRQVHLQVTCTGCPTILVPLCFLSFSGVLEHVQRNF